MRDNFRMLNIKPDDMNMTDERIKQVYFPVEGDYHLLSILTPSALLYELKNRINEIRFGEEAKQAREAKKKNLFHPSGFGDIYNLTTIG